MRAKKILQIVYKNYRNQIAVRNILPEKLEFGKTEFHPEEQWLVHALDIDKNEKRIFALKDMTFPSKK
jgi:hypothetical protein